MAIIERNDKGQVVASYLSSDTARAMVANRRTKEDKAASGAAAILAEMGSTAENPAPELVKNLAEIAVSQKTGAVSAISSLLKLAHGGEAGPLKLAKGERCPTCGQYSGGEYGYLDAYLPTELARMLADKLKVLIQEDRRI